MKGVAQDPGLAVAKLGMKLRFFWSPDTARSLIHSFFKEKGDKQERRALLKYNSFHLKVG